MTPIQVSINLNTSDALTSALLALADALRGLSVTHNYVTETAPAEAQQAAPTAEATPAPAPKAAPQAAATAAPTPAATITPEDIRAAINAVRVRLGCGHYTDAGAYQEDPDSEAYKLYNKAVTKEALTLASLLQDGCKPTTLPVELRQQFIDRLSTLIVGDDKQLTHSLPF